MDWIDEFAEAWSRDYPETDTSGLLLITTLARVSMLVDAFQREAVEPLGLTPSDYSVLAALRRAGRPYELSPSDLYNFLERSSGGMTKMLKRLESLGYVERAPDPEDGRSTRVALTASGIEVEEKIFGVILSRTHDLLAPVSRSKLEEIERSLRSLLSVIESHYYR